MSTTALAHDRTRPTPSDAIRLALRGLGVTPRRVHLPKGAVITLSERRSAGLYLMHEGAVKVVRISDDGRVLVLEIAGANEVFGEMTLFGDISAQATYAEALETSEIDIIHRVALSPVLAARPQLGMQLTELMGAKRTELEHRLERHVFRKVPHRLGTELLRLAERYGTPQPAGTMLRVRLSQQDLGGLIGASREMVSLTLADFRRQGLVSAHGRRLVVRVGPLSAYLDEGAP